MFYVAMELKIGVVSNLKFYLQLLGVFNLVSYH